MKSDISYTKISKTSGEKMTKEETTATWQSWLLDAIHKIRYQKQRPNVERISACIRMHHPQYSNEAVQEHIEMCVANKTISKVIIIISIFAGSLFIFKYPLYIYLIHYDFLFRFATKVWYPIATQSRLQAEAKRLCM